MVDSLQHLGNKMVKATEVITLPEWKNCLAEMQKGKIEYGKTYSAEFFEKELKRDRDDLQFSLSISLIRRELEKDGFYLSGKGQNGNQYVILQPENNSKIMHQYQRAAIDSLNRGVILGTNTPLYLLKEGDRIKHEQMLQNLANKAILLSRGNQLLGQETIKRLKQQR